MLWKEMRTLGLLAIAAIMGTLTAGTYAAEPVLKTGDLVAICGDSITEQRQYSVFIEDYLLMCQPIAKIHVMQFGWGGDHVVPLTQGRLANNVLRFHPTVMTTCYGMNDAHNPISAYRTGSQTMIDQAKKAGVRTIVLGSPGVVDPVFFFNTREAVQANAYNQILGKLTDIARELAQQNGLFFADVHTPMMNVMAKAKAKYGNKYLFTGPDGTHPGPNGHTVMAYAFLKAMNFDGNIGTISVDLSQGKATASEGHKVLSYQAGTVTIESTRYPFCFTGKPDDTSPNANSGIIAFFPFNEDLNRLTLVVANPTAEKLKVTWGKVSKVFNKAELTQGINLAAEFLENPFCAQFQKVHTAVVAQQNFETMFIRGFITYLSSYQDFASEKNKVALEGLAADGTNKDKALCDAAAALVIPIRHTLVIEEVHTPNPLTGAVPP
ncbi:MAG: SGNH/GDSL hydrolase family protein [Phycisphaerae bacterium]